MRIAVAGISVVASLVIVLVLASLVPAVSLAQRSEASASKHGGGLLALAATAGEQRQQITVIDPELRVLGVYHIDMTSGEIVLKSVRNIHWDLQLGVFNGKNPLPREVQALLEQK